MAKEKPKLFIVRKYIKAMNAASAIRKDKSTPVHDVWVDDDWKKGNLTDAIGFHVDHTDETEEE